MNDARTAEPPNAAPADAIAAAVLAGIAPEVVARAARVRLAIFDVDGVLTDGRLVYGADGEALKRFHVHDGHGFKLLRENGIAIALLSGRRSAMVERRARELKVAHVILGCEDKLGALAALLRDAGVSADEAAFMGDDWVDLAVMRRVGFAATVANAATGVRAQAHWCAARAGGNGAARDLCELLLAAQGKLDASYRAHLDAGSAQG
ncbi:KdsC family phosphatase [Derxia lacustris]|uniref:KdsC family phosphatase n=1 Tax=Derxia lacustris TaxID=764842 RepID=UPI00159457F1|nr:HAD-IIIA family hydrolase [Derxia lacustris]